MTATRKPMTLPEMASQRKAYGLGLATLAALGMAAPRPADAQTYSYHEITSALLGTPTLSPDDAYLDADGITNTGVVIGAVNTASPADSSVYTTGYEYDTKSGAATLINYQESFGGIGIQGASSDGSKILGAYYPNSTAVYFTDSNGSISNLPAPYGLPAGGRGNQAYYEGINSSGATVGIDFEGPGSTHHGAFLRNPDGTFTSLTDPDAIAYTPNVESGTLAFGINASGTIVGSYTYGYLPMLDGSLFNLDNGFIRNANGTYTNFVVPGEAATRPLGISDNGSNLFGQYIDDQSGLDFGNFADINGRFITGINVPDSLDGSTTLTGINDSGQISGYYADTDGVYHGFYASPTPEPSAAVFLGIGGGVLALFARRRKGDAAQD